MIAAAPSNPALPFLRVNQHHVIRFSLEGNYERKAYELGFPKMQEEDYKNGRFKEDTFVIDVNCWKFPVRDVVSLGPSRSFWETLWQKKRVKVQYLYGVPTKLTFGEARDEIVELICSKGWFGKTQDRESQKQFRERMALCENMRDLIVGHPNTDPRTTKRFQWIGGISFYGEWVG